MSLRGDRVRAIPSAEDLTLPLHVSYSKTIAELKMQLVKYRQALLDAGIEPPDAEGEDLMRMWQTCCAVLSAAQLALSELGTSKELLWPMKKS